MNTVNATKFLDNLTLAILDPEVRTITQNKALHCKRTLLKATPPLSANELTTNYCLLHATMATFLPIVFRTLEYCIPNTTPLPKPTFIKTMDTLHNLLNAALSAHIATNAPFINEMTGDYTDGTDPTDPSNPHNRPATTLINRKPETSKDPSLYMTDFKRLPYAVFAGQRYYPAGGMRDLHSLHPNEASAIAKCKELTTTNDNDPTQEYDWAHYVNLQDPKDPLPATHQFNTQPRSTTRTPSDDLDPFDLRDPNDQTPPTPPSDPHDIPF